MTIKLIVGLANYGEKYVGTRHNVGAWYVTTMVNKLGISLFKEPKFYGFTAHANFAGTSIHLLVPTTFMNLSGKSVAAISKFYQISPNKILIVHDELDLPPGIVKFKLGGSHGGHNGLKDVIDKLGNNPNFYRLRIGIGHPGDKHKVINFILNSIPVNEQKLIKNAISEAIFCTEIWIKEGLNKAINRLHAFKVK